MSFSVACENSISYHLHAVKLMKHAEAKQTTWESSKMALSEEVRKMKDHLP